MLEIGPKIHLSKGPAKTAYFVLFLCSYVMHEGQVRFCWTPSEKGLILGAFYYGYIVPQIPGKLAYNFTTDTDPNTGKNRSSTIFRYCCEFRYLSRSWQTLIKPQKLKENTRTQEIPFQKF